MPDTTSEADRTASVLEMLFQYVSNTPIDAAYDPRTPLQRERDLEAQLLRESDKRNWDYNTRMPQITPEFELLVKVDVFPPEIALAGGDFYQAIEEAVNLVWRHIPYENRVGIDVGTGTGVLALFLARHCPLVLATDIAVPAIANAKENFRRFKEVTGSGAVLKVIRSNLLEQVPDHGSKVALLVFNHPYYPSPISVFNVGGLDAGLAVIKPFLLQAKMYLRNGGGVIMPYAELAGEHNPLVVATQFGYKSTQLAEHRHKRYGRHFIYLFTL